MNKFSLVSRSASGPLLFSAVHYNSVRQSDTAARAANTYEVAAVSAIGANALEATRKDVSRAYSHAVSASPKSEKACLEGVLNSWFDMGSKEWSPVTIVLAFLKETRGNG